MDEMALLLESESVQAKDTKSPKPRRRALEVPTPPSFLFIGKEVRFFAASLARLLSGGVPLLRAISILEAEVQHAKFRQALVKVQNDLREGLSFSACLEKQKAFFASFFVEMVRAGEVSGTLDQTLKSVADHLERRDASRRKILEAISYPAFVLVFGFVTLMVLIQGVLPKMVGLYEGSENQLPYLTQFVLSLGDYSIPIFLGVFLLGMGSFFWIRHQQQLFWVWASQMPVLGKWVKNVAQERLFSLLALLLQSGIPILQAFDTAGNTSSTQWIQQDILEMRQRLSEGATPSEVFSDRPWLNRTAKALIASGEETGGLAEVFTEISNEAREELNSQTQLLIKLIEPSLILGVGLAVGLIVISAILPIFEMNAWAI